MQGRSLVGTILGKSETTRSVAYSETLYPLKNFGWSDLSSYTEGKLKFIEAPKPELYDLSSDPGERVNLYLKQRAQAEALRVKLKQFKQGLARSEASRATPADPQKMEALRSLGYVGVSVPPRREAGRTTLIDPKDRIQIFNRILLALQASDAGNLSKSDSILGEVVRLDPGLFIAHFLFGVNYLKAGDNQKALESFDRARALNPGFDLTDMNRGSALARLGKVDAAIAIFLDVLKRNPSQLEAKRQLGLLYSRNNEYQKAAAIDQNILAERPNDGQAAKFLGVALVDSEKYEEGMASLNQAVALGVDDAMVQNFLGIALGNLSRSQEAVAAYRKALKLKPDYHQARLNLSFALLKIGQTEDARKEFSFLCQQNTRLCEQYRKYFPAN